MISNVPKFNLGQLNAYKLMFAIKLSMEKRIKIFLAAVVIFLRVSKWLFFFFIQLNIYYTNSLELQVLSELRALFEGGLFRVNTVICYTYQVYKPYSL